MRQRSRYNLEVLVGEMVRGMDTQGGIMGQGENDGRLLEFEMCNRTAD